MKTEIRKTLIKKLAELSSETLQDYSERIEAALYNHPKWVKAKTIGVTVSRGNEVSTHQIIKKAWAEDKRVTVPKCVPLTKALDFRELRHFDQLESVYYGLMEPDPEKTASIDKSHIDLIIVPGIAYDPLGFRIGYGGGYYDRFLADYRGDVLAVAYSEQMIQRVPEEIHDKPVQTIITPDTTFECSAARELDKDRNK